MFRSKRRYRKAVQDVAQNLANLGLTPDDSGIKYGVLNNFESDCLIIANAIGPIDWCIVPNNMQALGIMDRKSWQKFSDDVDAALAHTKPNDKNQALRTQIEEYYCAQSEVIQ